MTNKLYGGIEAGGTKFVCMVAEGPEHIVDEARFATTTPDETLQRVSDFFVPHLAQLRGIGLGSFGPFDVDPESPTFGFITTTPKPHWSNVSVLGALRKNLNLPIAIDLDVAASGLGEARWGASKGLDPSLYLTVGTGIGAGFIVGGRPFRGLVSPEMGHIRIPHDPSRDPFNGVCPYHGDCFEGLAAGPSISARFGQRAETLAADHPFWDVEAEYIAYALVNYILVLTPKKIIIGGGVMQNEFMFPKIRSKVQDLLKGYVQHPAILSGIDGYIVPPALGNRAGSLGAIALAMNSAA
jgi:fructokinase